MKPRERFELLIAEVKKWRDDPADDAPEFNIDFWLARFRTWGWDAKVQAIETAASSCGTCMCIGGFATTIPALAADGLRLDMDGVHPMLTFNGKNAYEALADFLGISVEQARHCFDPFCYEENQPTLDQTIERMEAAL
jgi:hypothetical protein